MDDEFDVDIARGQAVHRPTRHVFHFRPSGPVDKIEAMVWHANPSVEKTPLEIIRDATAAIRRAMRHAGYH